MPVCRGMLPGNVVVETALASMVLASQGHATCKAQEMQSKPVEQLGEWRFI